MNINKDINIDKEILISQPVFTGIRVSVESLFDHLEAGISFDDFWMIFLQSKRNKQLLC